MSQKKLSVLLLSVFVVLMSLCGCVRNNTSTEPVSMLSEVSASISVEQGETSDEVLPDEIPLRASFESIDVKKTGKYTSIEEVASYIFLYEKLPQNYITKSEARKLGWKASEGNLWEVADGMSIGGDVFGNREGKLPKEEGRIYYECDIDYNGGKRNAKRIVYSNDGLIFYTEDHYNSFERLECT